MGFPNGVLIFELEKQPDSEGTTTSFFNHLAPFTRPLKWEVNYSSKTSFRGVYVHPVRGDYIVLLSGLATIGLKDFRRDSTTKGASATLELDDIHPVGVFIPPGVGYGIAFEDASVHIRAIFDTDSAGLICKADDPDLGIVWPIPVVSKPGHLSFKEALIFLHG